MTGEPLIMWVVYDKPADYPYEFVARRWKVDGDAVVEVQATHEMFVAPTLEELRALLPRGLTCMPRFAEDEPQIVEVWL